MSIVENGNLGHNETEQITKVGVEDGRRGDRGSGEGKLLLSTLRSMFLKRNIFLKTHDSFHYCLVTDQFLL